MLGDDVRIGAGATLLKGARIGSGSIVGAGAVVDFEVPLNTIVAGNPARVVGRADDFHSDLAPLCFTSRAHLSRSAAMKSRNSAGVLPTGSEPSSTMRLRMSGASSAFRGSARSRPTTLAGSAADRITPYQPTT